MYLLDTNHCSYIINNNPNVIAAVQSRSASDIGISIITYGELLYMTEKSERQVQNLAAVQLAKILRLMYLQFNALRKMWCSPIFAINYMRINDIRQKET